MSMGTLQARQPERVSSIHLVLVLGVRRKWLVKNGDAVEETEESVEPDRDDSVGYDS